MSSTDISLQLTYPKLEHAQLMLEVFEFWPWVGLKDDLPTHEQLALTESRMKALGYHTPQIFNYALFNPSCLLEYPASLEGNTIKLHFYCSKIEGWDFWDVLFEELTALPVIINGHFYCDMSGYEKTHTVEYK